MTRTQGYTELPVEEAPAQDYELWTRLMEYDDIVFVNLPEVLLRYRMYLRKR